MTCKEIENRLPAYLENHLSQDEKKIIDGHIASCSQCSRAVEALRKAQKIVRDLSDVEPPPFFEQRIMSRVREEVQQKQGILRKLFYPLYIKIPVQALATLLVAVIALSIYRTLEPELKHVAVPAIPVNEPAKDRNAAESLKGPSAPASVTPGMRASAGGVAEKKRQRFVGPEAENIAKAGRPDSSPALRQPEQALVIKPSAPSMIAGANEGPPFPETLNRTKDRAEKQEAGQVFEISPPEYNGKGKRAHVASVPAQTRATDNAARRQADLELAIQVRQLQAAIREVEEHLHHANGRIIEKWRSNGREFLRAEIATQNLAAFLDRIETIGRVNMKKRSGEIADMTVKVNIEIVIVP